MEQSITTRTKTGKDATPEERKKYFREKQRERRGGTKNHPYILDDGRRYVDVYPKEKRSVRFLIECPICLGEYFNTLEEQHRLTEKHRYAEKIRTTVLQTTPVNV